MRAPTQGIIYANKSEIESKSKGCLVFCDAEIVFFDGVIAIRQAIGAEKPITFAIPLSDLVSANLYQESEKKEKDDRR